MAHRGSPVVREITGIVGAEVKYPTNLDGGAPSNTQDAAWTGLRIENTGDPVAVSFESGETGNPDKSFIIAGGASFEAPTDVEGLYIYFQRDSGVATSAVKLFLYDTLLSATMAAGQSA